MRHSFPLVFLSLLTLMGCFESVGDADAGSTPDAGRRIDAGPRADTSRPIDTGTMQDAEAQVDAGAPEEDAGPAVDVGSALPEPMNHRPERVMCDNERDSPEVPQGPAGGCVSHDECTEGANGRCLNGRAMSFCSYDQCFEDSECTGPCVCGNDDLAANSCVGGGCQIDADCGPGGYCSPTYGSCGAFGGTVAYECHTADDECTDDVDCQESDPMGYCKFSNEASRWVCDNTFCVG